MVRRCLNQDEVAELADGLDNAVFDPARRSGPTGVADTLSLSLVPPSKGAWSGLDVLVYLEPEQPLGGLAAVAGPAGAIGEHGEQCLVLAMIGAA